ncbi:MAG: hypothetical protein V3U52_02530 [Thermoplasmata archaeon]
MPRKTYRDELLRDSDVKRWYDGLARNSKITAEERIRILGRFCRIAGWTPKRIVEKVREDVRARPDKAGTTFEDSFDDFIQAQLEAGRAPSYVENYRKTMTSWLRHNSLPFFDIRKLNMGDVKSTPTIDDESLPRPDQLRSVIYRATLRGRAIIAFVAFAGLRFEVLGNNEGIDGLRLKDLPDFEVKEGEVKVRRTPAMVKVRAKLSKTRRRYFSFLTTEGTEIVRAYLQSRLDKGEKLTQDSAIIRCTAGREFGGRRVNGANYGSHFIVSRNIAREVRESFGKEIRSRPYVLRSFFNTSLLIARSRAGMPPRDYRTFWMGHVGDIEATYSMNKHPTPEFIEDQRRAFQAAEPYLSTSPEGALNLQERMEREAAEREALEKRLDTLEKASAALAKILVVADPAMADWIAALETPAFHKALDLDGTLEMRNPETGDKVKVPIDHIVRKRLSATPETEQGGKMSVSQMLAKLLDEEPDEEENDQGQE